MHLSSQIFSVCLQFIETQSESLLEPLVCDFESGGVWPQSLASISASMLQLPGNVAGIGGTAVLASFNIFLFFFFLRFNALSWLSAITCSVLDIESPLLSLFERTTVDLLHSSSEVDREGVPLLDFVCPDVCNEGNGSPMHRNKIQFIMSLTLRSIKYFNQVNSHVSIATGAQLTILDFGRYKLITWKIHKHIRIKEEPLYGV